MENKKMYIITMATGSCDDYGLEIIAITDDFEKGSDYVNKKNTIYQSMEAKLESFQKNEHQQWYKDKPTPAIEVYQQHIIPKWKSDEVITKAMRSDRKILEYENAEFAHKARIPQNQWYQELANFTQKWFKDHLTEEELECYTNRNENQWSIEETPWL